MAGKGLGKTVLGWFVVQDTDSGRNEGGRDPELSSDELIAKYAQASEPASPPPVALHGELPPAPKPGAGVDFRAVYRAASISDAELDRVEKALALVAQLPIGSPLDVKKQIVETSLRAFGVPVDEIIEAGAQEIQALEAYIRRGEQGTQTLVAEARERNEQLTLQISELQRATQEAVEAQQLLERLSNDEKLRIQSVLEFFGHEAIARVVQQSPRLIAPT